MSRVIRNWGEDDVENVVNGLMNGFNKEDEIVEQGNISTVVPNTDPIPKTEINYTPWESKLHIPDFMSKTSTNTQKESLSDMEKSEWANRIQAMTDTEREFIITRFSTSELYEEIHRRALKDAEYINNIRKLVENYDHV